MKNGRLLVRPLSSLIGSNSSLFPQKHIHHPISLQNSTFLASILQHYINSSSPSHGQTIHAQILKAGLRPNTNVSIKLLILHLKCGSLANARNMFDGMPGPTLSAYNFIITGYFKKGLAKESLELVRKLAFSGEKPDGFILSMVLKLSATLVLLNLARQVHAQIIKLICQSDDVLIAALIDSYVKNGKVGYARGVFDALSERKLVCSTALIVGYMDEGSFRKAEEIFDSLREKDTVVFNAMIEGYSKTLDTAENSLEVYKTMQQLSFQPTISTLVSIIGACSLLSALEFGRQVHCQVIKIGLFSHVKSGSALIDMYSKCGRVEDARDAFDHMPEKNVFSWTSMIDGYGKNGIPCKALELFYDMRRTYSVKPNYATFLSALSACGHAGLVSSGQDIFESMERDYSLKPRMEHYACMVDLLGRSGNLREAYNFIKRIPERPSSDVWAALLGASRLHGNLDMADIAAKEVFELSKDWRPGAYVALSNTFAAAGKWEGVCQVRELMKERGVSKDTGRSWVGTDKGLCGFHVGELI
ncbi:pentatricopeptide repeat-containing protein At1g28690, mitochondrial [Phoenix dactylifera]|uniref:Pentatricopeptide repeat-containing protein At1g28690, mitochondrial n=1 Tax=Phoenix dactylifera TaxID=42345 RepID=A0A8B8IZS2_PHODC|nr:pentatricopeptide repeat-containing protein At1g28690, mitochondrial [Phoenix dactylifera]XP_038973913.1 pentatricopeptide repeat-containing protein At1g28690, mitochondrial [Phoenix dactylifera]XP_038973914.1 pentatricopeptide repeat-containing protein At1g28690, mitochondrial [Phoenix dactylifera]